MDLYGYLKLQIIQLETIVSTNETVLFSVKRSNPIQIWDMGSLNIKRLANQTVEGTLEILAFFLVVLSGRTSRLICDVVIF